ncbi:NAD(P)-dependent oxidoreductase [Sphingomonas hankookensis]|uniref:2-hydroxy-3-oxopropionate reductase n=1 Tax=Sphingomonas hengshuiensis TaxID=1609977 RepID=A0A2W5BB59_9SPHN|nr:MAG: 2-hydroxy-3-oxopropionate reductase [Sphingomonas hengshuiensis]
MNTVQPLRVAFIGLGNMGAPMARRLIAEGFALRAFDADPDVTATFGDAAAASAADAARDADVIVTMLPNGAIVRAAIAAIGDLRPGSVLLDMSSADAAGTVRLGRELAARGVALVDSPVSGGVGLAAEGKLALMVGADDDGALARVQPLLDALGARMIRTGGLGTGHAAKAINNAIAAANIAIAAEGLVIADRFGLSPETLLEVVNSSTGRSGVSETIFKTQILTGAYRQGFALALMAKDVGLAGDLARDLGLHLPQLAATEAGWNGARDALEPGADFTAYHRHVKDSNTAS